MAKRTPRPKVSPAQTDNTTAVMNTRGYSAPPPADDSTRSDSMASEPPAISPSRPVGDEDIRARAYQRYLERGGTHGQDLDDWIEAEQELRDRK